MSRLAVSPPPFLPPHLRLLLPPSSLISPSLLCSSFPFYVHLVPAHALGVLLACAGKPWDPLGLAGISERNNLGINPHIKWLQESEVGHKGKGIERRTSLYGGGEREGWKGRRGKNKGDKGKGRRLRLWMHSSACARIHVAYICIYVYTYSMNKRSFEYDCALKDKEGGASFLGG